MSMKDELDAVLAAQPNEGAVEWGISCASFMSRNGARLRAAVEDAEKWRLAYSLDCVTDPAEHGKLVEAINLRFKSGNAIPVERAHITAKEWSWINDRLNELQATRASENKTP